MATIKQSQPPQLGKDHSYKIIPYPGPDCKIIWFINGRQVTVYDEVGGLKVDGIGADGTISVEVIGDVSGTIVSAIIICSNTPPDIVKPISVDKPIPTPNTPPTIPPPDGPTTSDPPPQPPGGGSFDWGWLKDFLDFIARQLGTASKGLAFLLLWLLFFLWMNVPWVASIPGFMALLRFLWFFVYGVPFPGPPPTLPLPPVNPPTGDPPINDPPTTDPPTTDPPTTDPPTTDPPTTDPPTTDPPTTDPWLPPSVPCRVKEAFAIIDPSSTGGQMVAQFVNISVSPNICTWDRKIDYYMVTPYVTHEIKYLVDDVKITADVSSLAAGDKVIFTAVWTCVCQNGQMSTNYGQVTGIVSP